MVVFTRSQQGRLPELSRAGLYDSSPKVLEWQCQRLHTSLYTKEQAGSRHASQVCCLAFLAEDVTRLITAVGLLEVFPYGT